MNRRIPKTWFWSLTLVIWIFSVNHALSATGIIVTKSDERYENVIFSVDYYNKVLTLDINTVKKTINFSDVKAIYDVNGKEITSEIIGGTTTKSKSNEWKYENWQNFREVRKKIYKFGFFAAGIYTFKVGDNYKGGFGLEGDFIIPVSRESSLRCTFSKAELSDCEATRLFVSCQYNAPTSRRHLEKGLWYINFGFGAMTFSGYKTDIRFLTQIGGGCVTFLHNGLGIDYGLNFGVAIGGNNSYWQVKRRFICDLKLGLTYWVFNK